MPPRKLHYKKHRHDVFYKKAKQEQYAARSVYKLQEIDQLVHLFHPGDRVLDLGCWPGSWLQYTAKRIGPKGILVGIDRFAIELDPPLPNTQMIVGDIFDLPMETMRQKAINFNVVLSDMAPDTSGIRGQDQARSEALFSRALEISLCLLEVGGHFVGKLFQGPEWNNLLIQCRNRFSHVRTLKPEGTRPGSIEQYVIALAKRPILPL